MSDANAHASGRSGFVRSATTYCTALMTTLFEKVQQEPQIDFNIGDLNFGERAEVRRIRIQGADSWGKGAFNSVLYIDGEEKAAAKKFVSANETQLAELDFSKNRNALQEKVSREVYDWILHYLGERVIEKFETVVYESRPDGPEWIIDRDRYERQPNRRYTVAEGGVVKVTNTSVRELFESFGAIISKSGIAAHKHVDTRSPVTLLEYYRVAGEYTVKPLKIKRQSDDGTAQAEPALQKLTDESDE